MITAREDFPNLLRAAAALIRITHGSDCPEHAEHREVAARLVRAADAVESGVRLSVGELDEIEEIARRYRLADERVEVLA